MSGALLGLLLGIGLLLIWRSRASRAPQPRATTPPARSGRQQLLAAGRADRHQRRAAARAAGRPRRRWCCVVVLLTTGTVTVSAGVRRVRRSSLPYAQVRRLARAARTADLREVWPEVVDNLASAVRAGLSLPEALRPLAIRGPEVLRRAVRPVRRGLPLDRPVRRRASTGSRTSLADPVGDRIVESLRVAREVGGTDLGRVLRTLVDVPARGRPRPRRAGDAPGLGGQRRAARRRRALGRPAAARHPVDDAGRLRLARPGTASCSSAAAVLLVAYRLMLRIGRLPEDVRVLQ